MTDPTWGDRWRALFDRDDDADRARHSTAHAPPDEVDTDGPRERPEGQDDPPDRVLAYRALLVLLADTRDHLEHEDAAEAHDLRLRSYALTRVLHRLLDREGTS